MLFLPLLFYSSPTTEEVDEVRVEIKQERSVSTFGVAKELNIHCQIISNHLKKARDKYIQEVQAQYNLPSHLKKSKRTRRNRVISKAVHLSR